MNFKEEMQVKKLDTDTIYAGILGVAVGDAVGVPYEFKSQEEIALAPAADMIGHGTYDLPKGYWSDDTSMTLAAIDAMSKWQGREDYDAVMKCFCDWYYESKYTPADELFDCGNTCGSAIRNYRYHGKSTDECGIADEWSNGNGGLMRILPALFYVHAKYGENWIENAEAVRTVEKLTALTHANKRCLIASVMYLSVAEEILKGKDKETAVADGLRAAKELYAKDPDALDALRYFDRVCAEGFADTPIEDIRSGGYVIESIEASIWCFLNTGSYRECILKAVNLGHDTDTTAAIAGGLAGLYYGLEGIPKEWVSALAKLGYIKELCDAFRDSLGE